MAFRPVRLLIRVLRTTVYLVPAIVAWLLRIRFIRISTPDRIGHLVSEPDCYAKDRLMWGRREIGVIALRRSRIANEALLRHWSKYYAVFTNDFAVSLLWPFETFPFLVRDLGPYMVAMNATAGCYATYARWGHRPPLLALDEAERSAGRAALARLGVPDGAWFVCVHSREGGYSPRDEHWHTHRNSDIADYIPAMEAIVAAGGWCIRMGDPTMRPLPAMAGVVDYALSAEKSAAMDVFLCAECRFFVGNTSGLYIVAAAFGRPSALANMTPLSVVYGQGVDDVSIPKRVRRDGQSVPIQQLFESGAANYRFAEQFMAEGLEMVSNTPLEIRALVAEMLERLDGRASYTNDDDARQERFRTFLRPGHYSYGSASRIGRDFLRSLDEPAFAPAPSIDAPNRALAAPVVSP